MTDPASIADPARGIFITLEGGEGTGKTTQIKRLASRLAGHGADVVTTREPGGSPGAEIMRHVILSGFGALLGVEGEAVLFAAARSDHVKTLIAPTLARGAWVLCDRFADSTRVYQGSVGEVDGTVIAAVERATIGSLKPDLTLILDLDVETGSRRARARRGSDQPDRFEAEGLAFHAKLRDAYRALAVTEPQRCMLIDASPDADAVHEAIWNVMAQQWPHLSASGEPIPA